MKRHFRDLHTILIEISDEGRDLTPALRDEIVSFGECMSSEVVLAALHTAGTLRESCYIGRPDTP